MASDDVPRLVRRPRYVPFLLTGFVIGVVVTLVLVLGVGDHVDNPRKLVLYLGILLGGLGALAGGGLAVWLERGER
ncbi:hypothetical protein [Oryzihumus sp.]